MTFREMLDVFEMVARAELIKQLGASFDAVPKIEKGLADARLAALPIIKAVGGAEAVLAWESAQDGGLSAPTKIHQAVLIGARAAYITHRPDSHAAMRAAPGAVNSMSQITIERIDEADGSQGWAWVCTRLMGPVRQIASGSSATLSGCLDSMREYLRAEGIAP